MAKTFKPCTVPECKGVLEPGTRDGKLVEWCRACERRIAQLRALHESRAQAAPPPAPALKDVSEAQLMKLVQQRCWNLTQCAKGTRRSMNLIREAIKAGDLPAAKIGRYALVSKAAAEAWGKAYKRRYPENPATAQTIAALPRSAAEAITIDEWATRAKRSKATIATWSLNHRKDARLQRAAVFSSKGRPTVAYWWREATNA